MMIRKALGGLEVLMTPDDCAVLARACRHAADTCQPTGDNAPHKNRTDAYLFYLMACTLDAYSMIADADSRLSDDETEGWALPAIRSEWSPLVWDGGLR